MMKDDIQLLYGYRGAVKVGGSRERTSRVREPRNKRFLAKNASFSQNSNQFGAAHATSSEPFHLPCGQIALMMRQLGTEPLATDFHVFLVEGRRETSNTH